MSEVVEIDGDTIYVRDKQLVCLAVDAPDLFDTIDWLALAKQKDKLLQMITKDRGNQKEHILDGLVSVLDAIQDIGEARDYPVVYGYCRAEWEEEEQTYYGSNNNGT